MDQKSIHHHFAHYFKDKDLEPYLYVLSKRMESGHVCIPINESIAEDLIEGGFSVESFQKTNLRRIVLRRYFHMQKIY